MALWVSTASLSLVGGRSRRALTLAWILLALKRDEEDEDEVARASSARHGPRLATSFVVEGFASLGSSSAYKIRLWTLCRKLEYYSYVYLVAIMMHWDNVSL